uniref:ShKT domain-containing protein n=1 Tax=Arion vulgaris TaxID=1028688 RepID=A0A0B7BMW7_9EUPU
MLDLHEDPQQGKNTRRHCTTWGNQGYCTGMFSAFMSTHCNETCGLCRSLFMDRTAVLKRDSGDRADNGVNKVTSGLITFLCEMFKYCGKM